MKNSFLSHVLLIAMLALQALIFAGCGGGDSGGSPASAARGPSSNAPAPARPQAVSETEHQKFEKKYAEMCVHSQQIDNDTLLKNDQELGKVCECMAKEVSKRIGKADAVHFLERKEFPFDMVMMTNAAANNCLGKK